LHLLSPAVGVNQPGDTKRCALQSGNVHTVDGWRGAGAGGRQLPGHREAALFFRRDAAIASPEMYEFLEAEGTGYTIRLPTNRILQHSI